MQFSDLPAAFDDSDLSGALALARELEQGECVDHHEFAKRLGARASSDSLLLGVVQLLSVDAVVCGLMLGTRDARVRWDSALVPAMEWFDPPRVAPPPVAEFPDVTRPYLEVRARETGLAELRARYLDFLWLRWRDHRDARRARAAYVSAAAELETSREFGSVEASERLQRAAELSLQFHDGEPETATAIQEFALRTLDGQPGPPCFLVEAAGAFLVRADPEAAEALAEAFSERAEHAGAIGKRWDERAFRESAEALARELGDSTWATELKRRSARSLELEAAERAREGVFLQSSLIREAITAYAAVGDSASVQRLKADYAAASARIGDELKEVGVEFAIPPDLVNGLLQVAAAHSDDPAAWLALPDEWGMWPTRAALEGQQEGLREAAPFLSMIQHTSVEIDGRVQPEPADPEQARDARLTHLCAERAQFAVGLLLPALERLRADGLWTVERLASAIEVADRDLAASVGPGLNAYEQRDWWLALHALTPQVERGIRIVARHVGAPVTRLAESHGWRWASFGEMLDEPAARDAIGDDLAFSLSAIFDSRFGPDYRNNVAHGAFPSASDCLIPATLALLALLSVANRVGNARPPGQDRIATIL